MKRAPILLLLITLACCTKEPVTPAPPLLPEPDEAEILAMIPTNVPNTAYYKELFLDGGCELNPGIKENGIVINGRLPYAIATAGIKSCEYFLSTIDDVDNGYIPSDLQLQTDIISGTPEDLNGVLLYPDGEPRFRMMYVFGGHSGPHGKTIGVHGRRLVNVFYTNGGSYVGSCAGAYLAGRYAGGGSSHYFDLWKGGNMNATGVGNSSIDIEMVSDSFVPYFGPSINTVIKGARHNGGGYMDVDNAPPGTEVIARFLNQKGMDSSSRSFYMQPAVWAYKASPQSGRVVVTGSHPEDAPDGDILKLTASMFRYGYEGSGCAKVKGILRKGDLVPMKYGTQDNRPEYTCIGDLQCHHFVFYLNAPVPSVTLRIEGEGDYDLELYLKKDGFAFPWDSPDYSSCTGGPVQQIETPLLSEGLWYVTVRCATTVTATETIINPATGKGRRFIYSGKTGVLNGVPYSISVDW